MTTSADPDPVRAAACMAAKCKPPGSLGALEQWAIQLSQLQHTLQPQLAGACLLLFAADHGVAKTHPGVSAYPAKVTPAMFSAIAAGQAASSVLCAANSCSLILTDVGVDADVAHITTRPQHSSRHITVLHRKVALGSACFTLGPAMTQQQCQQAMQAGADAVELACQHLKAAAGEPAANWSDSQVALCIGELGIGNTTAAAALLAALTGAGPVEVCGRGTGVDDAGLAAKQAVVAAGLAANEGLAASGPLGALQAVGGLELAAMTGAFLAAARRGVPVIADGFVSGVAALVALREDAAALRRSLFLSHRSAEKAAGLLIEQLGSVPPVLDMSMRLGEGTGAVLALSVLQSAAAVMSHMASLAEVMAAASGRAGSGDDCAAAAGEGGDDAVRLASAVE